MAHTCKPGCGPHLCRHCGNEFVPLKRSDQKYCGKDCRETAWKEYNACRCAWDGCGNTAMPGLADGLCQSHHRRRVAGHPMDPPLKAPIAGKVCSVKGCDEPVASRGMCSLHYNRSLQGRDLEAPRQRSKPGQRRIGVEPCIVPGCDRTMRGRGMCAMHYLRWSKTGDVGPAESKVKPKGSITIDKNGYAWVDGKHQHRTVMEGYLGRPLQRWEQVHHRNGRRADNRLANLELWVRGHPAGQRVEDLIAFVIEHYPEAARAALEGKPQESWLAPRAVD